MKKILTIVFSMLILISSSLLVKAEDQNTNQTQSEDTSSVVFLDKTKFKEAMNSLPKSISEGSTFHLYFGNQNDYSELISETPISCFGGVNNKYYSVYCKEVQDANNVYDIYVLANCNQKVYFPKESNLFFSKQSIPHFESRLISIDFKNVDTSNVITMQSMFSECRVLTSLDLTTFDTSKVFNMNNMFYGCSSLEDVQLNNFNTSNVTDMASMFTGCSSLKSLDVSNFDTTNVKDMNNMFAGCSSLKSLDLSHFNTSNVGDKAVDKIGNMKYMFYKCSALESLDLSYFDTSKVTDLDHMFAYCSSLKSLNVSHFNTSNVTNMEHMFEECHKLTFLNLCSFDTSNVTNMAYMFNYCDSLSLLGLPKFNTSKVIDMTYMFRTCLNLRKIYVSNDFNVNKVTSSNGMFGNCNNLVGGSGTKYTSAIYNSSYAHIDTKDNPGYFTDIKDCVHQAESKVITKEPTCTETGIQEFVCLLCGEKVEETIEALGHDYSMEWTIDQEATTTTEGIKSHHCIRCDDKTDLTVIPKIPSIIDGEEQVVSENEYKDLSFRSSADFKDFVEVRLNDEVLDKKYYTVLSGSTIVTLSANYIFSLKGGLYKISIVSTTGIAEASFTVKKKENSDNHPEKENQDSSTKVVDCKEIKNSKNWTWSDTKNACVYKVSKTSVQ